MINPRKPPPCRSSAAAAIRKTKSGEFVRIYKFYEVDFQSVGIIKCILTIINI